MSNLTNNTAELNKILAAVNALPEAGEGGVGDTSAEDALVARTVTTYSNDRVTNVGTYAFYTCSKLTTVSLPKVTLVSDSAFSECSALTSAYLPLLQTIGSLSFYACYRLGTIELPSVTSVGVQSFRNCINLVKVDLGAPTSIAAMAFSLCDLLETLIIRTTKLCKLNATSAISGTKIAAGTGYIYVPRTLSDGSDGPATYAAATNWSTYAAQIRAIEDYPEITGG